VVYPKGFYESEGLPIVPDPMVKQSQFYRSQSAPFGYCLCTLQSRFSGVTFLLVTAMLTVYGWTVYSQNIWNQAYQKARILQRHERQLTTTNEVLKNQMALQAEQPATLVRQSCQVVIFLKPAPQRSDHAAPVPPATASCPDRKPTPIPLGIKEDGEMGDGKRSD